MSARVKFAVTGLFLLMAIGTLGYHLIERWTLLDSFYMTVITLSTVGFGELRPLSGAGKVFTSGLIFAGVGTLAYTAARLIETFIEQRVFYRRRMQMEIKRLRDHVVVCGYGRMGETVRQHLASRRVQTVVIERDPAVVARLEEQGFLHLAGDSTEDAVLTASGVERASALATVLPNDADNLFVTLSARSLNPEMTIVARACTEKNEKKMIAAGATRVLNPYRNGGRLMVRQLLHPVVTEFFDVISAVGDTQLSLEEVQLQPGSPLSGTLLRNAPIRREMDVIVLGIRRDESNWIFNPPHDLGLETGDVLVVLGHSENLARLEILAEGPG